MKLRTFPKNEILPTFVALLILSMPIWMSCLGMWWSDQNIKNHVIPELQLKCDKLFPQSKAVRNSDCWYGCETDDHVFHSTVDPCCGSISCPPTGHYTPIYPFH